MYRKVNVKEAMTYNPICRMFNAAHAPVLLFSGSHFVAVTLFASLILPYKAGRALLHSELLDRLSAIHERLAQYLPLHGVGGELTTHTLSQHSALTV